MSANHGIVFNGWCMKALAYITRNAGRHWTKEAAWLERKGIPYNASSLDESLWNLHNVQQHYQKHYAQCYEGGCR